MTRTLFEMANFISMMKAAKIPPKFTLPLSKYPLKLKQLIIMMVRCRFLIG